MLTHTGGVVSRHYINNCQDHKVNIKETQIGIKLSVDSEYYANSVNTIYEIGAKLCHVCWRKFAKEDRSNSDAALSRFSYDLIVGRAYSLAETILNFATKTIKTHSNDKIRRMMVVNLANSIRLQKRPDEAKTVIDGEDWSASSDDFKICVACIREDVDSVIDIMKSMGRNGSISIDDYRSWPIFRGIRVNKKFVSTFEEIFGEPFFSSKKPTK